MPVIVTKTSYASVLLNGDTYGQPSNGLSPSVISLFNWHKQNVDSLTKQKRKHFPKTYSVNKCEYCGINDPNCIVRCNFCNKWFCNGRLNTSGSHAVYHCIKAQHNEVVVPKDVLLECLDCDCANVFNLGYFVGKTHLNSLLCRQPCDECKSHLKDKSWDSEEWKPIIRDRVFVPWVVGVPSGDQLRKARQLTTEQINKLERLWRKGKSGATFKDLHKQESHQRIKFQTRYENENHYLDIFSSLVGMESDYQKQMKHMINVRWNTTDGYITATFKIPRSGKNNVMLGDKIQLTYMGQESKEWSGIGKVTKIFVDVTIEMINNKGVPTNLTSNFVFEFLWKNVSFKRMQGALSKFARGESSVSRDILHILLYGCQNFETKDVLKKSSLPKQLSAPNLPKLNPSQEDSVRQSLTKSLSLIQGPPGTGKTVTSATIAYNLVIMNKNPILVCAQSNTAVDQLTEKIGKTGVNIVRLYAKRREVFNTSVSSFALHLKICELDPELNALQNMKNKMEILYPREEKRYQQLKKKWETIVLRKADVISCTCVGAGDYRLTGFRFHSVLIDESTQSTEPECIIPIGLATKQLILVGDHKQLGPVIMCKKAEREGLQQSLFERLVALGVRPLILEIQYRMHPCLSEFPSKVFYGGALRDGVTTGKRTMLGIGFPWPRPDKPMFVHCCEGEEELSSSGTSFLNRKEASYVEKAVTYFLECGAKPQQIGVITPYDGQRRYLFDYMLYNGRTSFGNLYKDIEVDSVNAFQGREKDFIIISCVRSNDYKEIGFLSDKRRLNVALTRARFGLIIVGNPYVFPKDSVWYDLLKYYKNNRVLVEGELGNLKERHVF